MRNSIGGREQLVVCEFAQALEIIPTTLAENAGLDSLNILIEMRKVHQANDKFAGLSCSPERSPTCAKRGF